MFISKYEKEALQQKVENLSLLVAQTSDRAHKSEEKILELSLKLTAIEEVQSQQKLTIMKTLEEFEELEEEFEEIEGFSDKIIKNITSCDSRFEGMENFVASRFRHYDGMEKDLKVLSKANKNTSANILILDAKFDVFIKFQNENSGKIKEHIKC